MTSKACALSAITLHPHTCHASQVYIGAKAAKKRTLNYRIVQSLLSNGRTNCVHPSAIGVYGNTEFTWSARLFRSVGLKWNQTSKAALSSRVSHFMRRRQAGCLLVACMSICFSVGITKLFYMLSMQLFTPLPCSWYIIAVPWAVYRCTHAWVRIAHLSWWKINWKIGDKQVQFSKTLYNWTIPTR